jgi:hypothetical protein
LPAPQSTTTVFHTEYFWWGSGARLFDIILDIQSVEKAGAIELRVHRQNTAGTGAAECVSAVNIPLSAPGPFSYRLVVDVDGRYSYALLGILLKGSSILNRIEVISHPANMAALRERTVRSEAVILQNPGFKIRAKTALRRIVKKCLS